MAGDPIGLLKELVEVRARDVLDIGCGKGVLARRLASAGARVVGLDPSAAVLESARGEEAPGSSTRYVQGSAEALPFPDASFDVVIFFNSLHHVPAESMDAALLEAGRVLRPSGVVYVQEPLAEGPLFELMLRVEDETGTRRAAQEALQRALDGGLSELTRRNTVLTVRHADFDVFRERMLTVEPARGTRFDAHESTLRSAFEELGRATPEGYEFEQPIRINLLGL